jgi:isopentenyldiphosphate isomerase
MAKEEIVTIVDQNNQVVGAEPRSKMRAEGLPHRANYILVFNSEGELFLQERTMNKDIYPGYHDVATGGVVLAGESYDASALRELEEELGIRGVKLKQHFDFYHEDVGNRVWGRVYSCVYDGDIVLQEEEVAAGGFYTINSILKMSTSKRFTPDGMHVLQRFLKDSSFRISYSNQSETFLGRKDDGYQTTE